VRYTQEREKHAGKGKRQSRRAGNWKRMVKVAALEPQKAVGQEEEEGDDAGGRRKQE
jgi:hypothetical protein